MAKQKEVRWITCDETGSNYWEVRDRITELLSTGWKVESAVYVGNNRIQYIFTKSIKQIQEETFNGDV